MVYIPPGSNMTRVLMRVKVPALQLICLGSILDPNTHLILRMSFMHGIGEHYLKGNYNGPPDKVITSQNCDADGFCAAHGNVPVGSN